MKDIIYKYLNKTYYVSANELYTKDGDKLIFFVEITLKFDVESVLGIKSKDELTHVITWLDENGYEVNPDFFKNTNGIMEAVRNAANKIKNSDNHSNGDWVVVR